MNRSNVLEIKKTFKTEDFSIDTICTCFVNGNKEKLMTNTEKTISLDEEEVFKYIDIFKGVLTGAVGKKLINLEFSPEGESKKAMDNMQSAYKGIFSNEAARDSFFDGIIEKYEFGENFLLVSGHGLYDAPVKAKDGAVLEDESSQYEFMVTAICPVHSTKAGLTLDRKTGRMISSKQVQIVEAPVHGFLYPAFNDRASDLSGLLYFTKKPDDEHAELIEYLTGKEAPTSCVKQQIIFESILAEVTDDHADFEVVKNLHENLQERVLTDTLSPSEKELKKDDVKAILLEAGITEDRLSDFDHIFERHAGSEDDTFSAVNLMDSEKINIKAPDVEIKVKNNRRDLVKKKMIDGKNCLVVTLEGDIDFNGIQVKG